MDIQAKTKLASSVLSAVNEAIGQMITVQDFIHKNVLIEAVRYVFIYKDATLIEKVLNNITGVKGSFRVETLGYWFQQVAGISVDYNEKKGWHSAHLAKDEYQSNHSIPFTYDKAHLAFCKNELYRFWKIAPVVIKELKAPELETVTNSAEIQLARGLSIGALTDAEIQAHIDGMMQRVKEAINSKAVRKWTGEYYAQNPQAAPISPEELAESDLLEESDTTDTTEPSEVTGELVTEFSDLDLELIAELQEEVNS